MFEVTISGRFLAAHQLRQAEGACEPLHEHDWRVTATVAGPELDAQGLLVDFGRLRDCLHTILARFEGQTLNRVAPFTAVSPSAERVARYVYEELAAALPRGIHLTAVEVEEEPGCTARYREV